MKRINSIKTLVAAALISVSTFATAAPKAKVVVSATNKPEHAIVSVFHETEDVIKSMELYNESGVLVYTTGRTTNVKSAQYMLNLSKVEDGAYLIKFTFENGKTVSKYFVIDGKEIIK